MKRKFIFFDIDGTLTDDNPGGKILPSTIKTLQKLRENGHFVAIATGRAQFFAADFMKENGFENMVSDGGNGITINQEIVEIIPMDLTLSKALIAECIEKQIPYGAVLNNEPEMYGTQVLDLNRVPKMMRKFHHIDSFADVKAIYKIFIYGTKSQVETLVTLQKLEYMSYTEGEIIVEPLEKFKGIKRIVAYMNGDLEDVVVFGDGKNDISMMKQAKLSIAMGNAIPELKEIASFVTKSNKEDGIAYACKHFGWID